MTTPATRHRASSSTPSSRFDTYTRWSLYTLAPAAPLMAVALVAQGGQWPLGRIAYVLLVTVAAGLYCPVVTASVRRAVDGGRPSRLGKPLAAVGAAAAVLGPVLMDASPDTGLTPRTGAFLIPALTTAAAFVPLIGRRHVVVVAGVLGFATALLWSATQAERDPDTFSNGRWFPALFSATLISLGVLASVWASVWMLRQMREQAELTQVRSQLAVAEERLRFSRDLHDIFGRTLTTVSVKADLAAELAARGRADDAGHEMREVQRLAEEAMREVRSVAGGYRAVDLTSELQGAGAVLRSAGISARLIGDGAGLPPRVAEALAWVVREAVTNVMRHSEARSCTVTLSEDAGHARVEVRSDGPRSGGHSSGSGITGLRDRLSSLGGTVEARATAHEFVLIATVPLEGP